MVAGSSFGLYTATKMACYTTILVIFSIAAVGSLAHADEITVDTPEAFEQLKDGQIGNIFDNVYVQQGAHPDPLSQVPLLTKASLRSVHFMDDEFNEIAIWPRIDIAKAYFKTCTRVSSIPADFKEFAIYFQNGQNASEADVRRISRFSRAAHLLVHDNDNVAGGLLEHVDALAEMKHLYTLQMNVHVHNFRRIHVGPFLEKVPSKHFFRHIAFNVTELSRDDLTEFIRMQDVPDKYYGYTWKGILYFKERQHP